MTNEMRNLMNKIGMNNATITEEDGLMTAREQYMMVREFFPTKTYKGHSFVVVDACGNSYDSYYENIMNLLNSRY